MPWGCRCWQGRSPEAHRYPDHGWEPPLGFNRAEPRLENSPGLQCWQELGRELEVLGKLGAVTDRPLFSSQTSQKSCEPEPRVSPSQNLLEEEDSEPPSQQLQATRSRGSEPLSNLDLSEGPLEALEYLPFFRTYGQLLAEEELTPRTEVCRDRGGDQRIREAPCLEDSGPASGFFPYYRSKEESFPSLTLPDSLCAGSCDPPIRMEAQARCCCCCCRMTVSDKCSVSRGGHRGCREQHRGSWHPSDLCPRVPGPGGLTRPPKVSWGVGAGGPPRAVCHCLEHRGWRQTASLSPTLVTGSGHRLGNVFRPQGH